MRTRTQTRDWKRGKSESSVSHFACKFECTPFRKQRRTTVKNYDYFWHISHKAYDTVPIKSSKQHNTVAIRVVRVCELQAFSQPIHTVNMYLYIQIRTHTIIISCSMHKSRDVHERHCARTYISIIF